MGLFRLKRGILFINGMLNYTYNVLHFNPLTVEQNYSFQHPYSSKAQHC